MLQRIIGEHINLRIQCAEHLPPVFADAVNFEQIVINLAVNARDAMPRGGPLTITVEPVEMDAKSQGAGTGCHHRVICPAECCR